MHELHRVIDANVNRVCEGLRVVEDVARLRLDSAEVCAALRDFRHAVRRKAERLSADCLAARRAEEDVGLAVSQSREDDRRPTLSGLVAANFKRVQEGLRVIEETLKLAREHDLAKEYEALRFCAYALEQRYAPLVSRRSAHAVAQADICGITAEEHSLGRGNLEVVGAMLAAGITVIQYREKDKAPGDRLRECLAIRRMTRETGATFIVNDHPELALMVGADGVHLGQDDYPIEAVRRLVGEATLIGVSTHSPRQAEDAVRRGADYIGVGPLFRTHTKKDVCDAVGLEYLDHVVVHVPIPFVAIGGIKLDSVGEVRRRGARCIALVTEIVGAFDIPARVDEIRSAMKEGERQTA